MHRSGSSPTVSVWSPELSTEGVKSICLRSMRKYICLRMCVIVYYEESRCTPRFMSVLRLEGRGMQGKGEEIKTSRYGETRKSRAAIKKNK